MIFVRGSPATLPIKLYLSRHIFIVLFCFNYSVKGAHRQGATIVSPHGTIRYPRKADGTIRRVPAIVTSLFLFRVWPRIVLDKELRYTFRKRKTRHGTRSVTPECGN